MGVRRQSKLLFLVLACLAWPELARAQRVLPPPIFGPYPETTSTSAKPPDAPGAKPLDASISVPPVPSVPPLPSLPAAEREGDQEVIATTKALSANGNEGETEAVIGFTDGTLRPAGNPGSTRALVPGTAAIAVGVEGPRQVAPGEAMECAVVVQNLGGHTVAQVGVELALPTGARLLSSSPETVSAGSKLSWKLGNLEAGGQRRLKLDIQTPASGEMTLLPSVTFAAAVGLRTRLERPTLAITQNMPETINRGETTAIGLVISNKGTTPLTNLVVHENLPDGLHHPVGKVLEVKIEKLGPGETRTLTVEPQAVRLGKFINVVEITGDGGARTTSRRPLVVAEAGLTMRLDGPDRLPVGKEADLRLVLGNSGNHLTPLARVVLPIPEGLEIVAASSGATTDANHAVAWTLPALEPGTMQTVTLRLRPRQPGDWNLEATATMGAEVSIVQQRNLHVEGTPALQVEVRLDDEPLAVGSEAMLEVTVHNTGTFAAQDLRVTVHAPDLILLEDAEGPSQSMVAGPSATWTPLPDLASHREAVYHCRVRGVRPGDQHILVDVQARGMPQALHEGARCRVQPRELPEPGTTPPAQ